ncbi:SGNH/GDSL hydrolase family protein [Massilia sp. TS11]|uniref:SGNH/GDSL hydrolase family protein n=1 Tax=Massilia sp. TS11 TaxID=2908003 RepID=UPI001EDB9049|nr:SGNH/GDSL hydrolase family protein [Massilia sp. TS11]MCG2586424.1 SGNH/GDSL hydrolase family protein [Massilia sp. TS11]
MRNTKFALALLASAVLAACGGGTGSKGGDQTLKTKFSAQVSFGDSLSDLGTYAVGTVAAIGGGRYTINGDNTATNAALTGKNWTELLAAQFGLPAPCPAMTGLDGDASKGFAVPVKTYAGCYSYAQGGARVTNPVGPGNKLTGSPIGQLTVPVVTQVANHLKAVGGKFKGDEIVFVMAGGNDALEGLGELSAGATKAGQTAGAAAGAAAGAQTFATTLTTLLASGATNPATAAQAIGTAIATESARAGHTDQSVVAAAVGAAAIQPGNAKVADPAVYGPMVAKAQADATAAGTAAGNAAGQKAAADYLAVNGPKLVPAMAQAGAELAALVKTQIVGNGANYVVVNNLPDLGNAPAGKAQDANTQALIKAMVDAFNQALASGLNGESKIMLVDLYSISHDQITNPGPYGLTNTTSPACGSNPLGTTSLGCNGKTLVSGDVSHYMFADDVHPTPFENLLIARYVAQQMIARGWL